ncbi:MAG: hypothetical protein CMN58_05710 [Solibacterales bacterium]|nr:hypothetical protein [Bryobacterales bacterium]
MPNSDNVLGRRAFLLASTIGTMKSTAAPTKIRAAVWGIGHGHARGKVETLRRMDDFELVGICEPDPKQSWAHETYQGVRSLSEREMLDDDSIRLIAVESDVRNNLNFRYAQKAIEAGKFVHLDKPPGDSLTALQKLLTTATEKNLVVQMGYQWRYHEAMQKAIEAAREGWLGSIYMVRATIDKPLGQDARNYDAAYPGGMMFDLGSHMIDRIVALLGKPKNITSWIRHDSNVPDNLADNTLAVFEYDHALAEVYIAAQRPNGNRYRTFQISGTKGTATVRPFFPNLRVHFDLAHAAGPYKKGSQTIEIENKRLAPYEPDFSMMASIIRGGKPDYSVDHDLITQEVLLRACKML